MENTETEQAKKALLGGKYRLHDEKLLHESLSEELTRAGLEHTREHNLGKGTGRIDFLLAGGTGIEVKINGAGSRLLLQASRYLKHPEIKALLIVTVRPQVLPTIIHSKPLSCVALWQRLGGF